MEKYLFRCLESVSKQSHSNLEILLVDDGSTDRSTAICREWERKDKRIRYIWQENAGPGAARNKGIEISSADYITFLDSDDWFELTFIEKLIKAMLENNSDISQCDINYIDSITLQCQLVKLRYESNVVSCSNKSVVNKSRLFIWGKIFKRTLLKRCEFCFPTIVYEDTCIPVLIIKANKISYVPEPLINYFRNRQSSLSNDCTKIHDIKNGLQFLYHKLNELDLYSNYQLEYKKILLGQFRFACRKWDGLSDETVQYSFRELEEFVVHCFPNLSNILTWKFFAFKEAILVKALDKAIPYANQLVDDIAEADVVVAFKRDVSNISESTVRIISVSDYLNSEFDGISKAFNIAEQIMEKL